MVCFIYIIDIFKEDRDKLLEIYSERKEATNKLQPRKFQLYTFFFFSLLRGWSQTGTGEQGDGGVPIVGKVQNPNGYSPEQPELYLKLDLASKLILL